MIFTKSLSLKQITKELQAHSYQHTFIKFKPCDWVYIGSNSLKFIENSLPKNVNRDQITMYAKREDLILLKYIKNVS